MWLAYAKLIQFDRSVSQRC